jgi:rhodanese-related sulfurtransferase
MGEPVLPGVVTPTEAYAVLASEPRSALVDVRTEPEWAYVGLPDLANAAGVLLRIEWQEYPSMRVKPDFAARLDAALRAAGCGPQSPVFFICRSGARSAAAAAVMAEAGYAHCYNVAGGFEGRRDEGGHRGTVEGWKAESLPWTQS